MQFLILIHELLLTNNKDLTKSKVTQLLASSSC